MNQNEQPQRRFILIVLDGCGAGALPDASEFGPDDANSNTLAHTAQAVGGLAMPNLAWVGWGNVTAMAGVPAFSDARGAWGRLAEISRGKDTVTGHWEMMGVHTDVPFPTYPDGFPADVLQAFAQIAGLEAIGNGAASGTEILTRLGEEHVRTGRPIVYTSADSVFQVAAHEDPAIFGLERLLDICERSRQMLSGPHAVGRVIARPFVGQTAGDFKRTENRRDYPLPPPHDTVLDILEKAGRRVHGIGKISEIFGGRGITSREQTTNNRDHMDALTRAITGEAGDNADFIFANLEDFDMLYGHRNDPHGFARLLNEFDHWTKRGLIPHLRAGDLVGITADHGNDPTTPSTDHAREYAPLLVFGPAIGAPVPLGDRATFGDWGATVLDWLGVSISTPLGSSFLPELRLDFRRADAAVEFREKFRARMNEPKVPSDLTERQRDALGGLLHMAFKEIRLLSWDGKSEQAADLADAVCQIPLRMGRGHFAWDAYIKNLTDYQEQYPEETILDYVAHLKRIREPNVEER